MLEALRLHKAWADSEHAGPDYGEQRRDTHPDGEAIWSRWWNYQLDICDRANTATDAAIALVERSGPRPPTILETAARVLLDATGGNPPDWLRDELAALEAALLANPGPKPQSAESSTKAALEMFETCFAEPIENGDEMGGADTIEAVCSLWHRFIKPALAEARGEVRTYSRNEDQEG